MPARANIPNYLTFARVAAIPAALVMMYAADWHPWLFWLFSAAAITDFLDGYLARKWQVVSTLGALLDPVADKLLVALMLLFLLLYHGDYPVLSLSDEATGLDGFMYPTSLFLPVVVILLRELYISGLREFLAARGVTLPVSKGGKLKTATQMLGIATMLAAITFTQPELTLAGGWLVWAAAAIALVSAVDYTRKSWPHLR